MSYPGTPTKGRCSRQASDAEDGVERGTTPSSDVEQRERPSHIALSRISGTAFDDLSPILEDIAQKISRKRDFLRSEKRRSWFGRTISEPEKSEEEDTVSAAEERRQQQVLLKRRNSSPSVSMFSGSARDRVSPQAVQDLLELCRLGGAGEQRWRNAAVYCLASIVF